MTKYAKVDASGRVLGFYSDDIHGARTITETGSAAVANPATKIPADAVAISDAMYAQWIGNTAGQALHNGALVKVDPVKPAPTWDDIRRSRNALLSNSDWTQISDSPLGQSAREAWAKYRAVLRDIPQSFKTPATVTWPAAPPLK
jgi:hypothetical protein